MSQCRLCGLERKLVKAHVIPEAFFRVLRTGGETPILVSNVQENPFRKRAPIGVYDEGILCAECEDKFGQVDSYGAEVLLTRFHELIRPVVSDGKIVGYQAEGNNQDLLLRFFIATLWRASISTHTFFRRVRLGAYEDQAKHVIDLKQSVPPAFGAVLSLWSAIDSSTNMAHGLMDPFRERFDGVNSYRVYFGQIVAYIRVDKRPFAHPLRDFALCHQEKMLIIARDFRKSKDFLVMAKVAKESQQQAQLVRALRKKR